MMNNEQVLRELSNSLGEYLNYMSKVNKKTDITEDDKRLAAYALNMCTVSISQIIDYADVNILDQEYETILNNINLEVMPKDEALLHIYRQMLDTITYFRVAEGEKEMIEKEYEYKMKNAIWSSVPNFGLLVAGGDMQTVLLSLANQVGIGYMNYRRNRNDYHIEREKQLWQLRKTAIEQFNALRRELFDTSWRLADIYNFPDEYRLTERQISQYNRILKDRDEIRKYERLDSIKESFEAYPPFWYFIGNCANYISEDQQLDISKEKRLSYKRKAQDYFEKFESMSKHNILRNDILSASCTLEHADLLMSVGKYNKNTVLSLIESAQKNAGNAFDVLELCAIAYLKIDESKKAAKILRTLVNEDYNSIINAQLLSCIYVNKNLVDEYYLLSQRVDGRYLFPFPETGESLDKVQKKFDLMQKDIYKKKTAVLLENVLYTYSIKWNKLTSVFTLEKEYDDKFFDNSTYSGIDRKIEANRIFNNVWYNNKYIERMKNTDFDIDMLDTLNNLFNGLFKLSLLSDSELQDKIVNSIRSKISANSDKIVKLKNAIDDEKFGIKDYRELQKYSLDFFVQNDFEVMKRRMAKVIDQKEVKDIIYIEEEIRKYCLESGVHEPEVFVNESEFNEEYRQKQELFNADLFGYETINAVENRKLKNEMLKYAQSKMDKIDFVNPEKKVWYLGSASYNSYFCSKTFEGKYASVRNNAFMVIEDNGHDKTDLVFTTEGIVTVINERVKNKTPYNDVEYRRGSLVLYKTSISGKMLYKNDTFDNRALYSLVKELGAKFIVGVEKKVEYIENTLEAKTLTKWFKDQPNIKGKDITCVVAVPKASVMKGLGYYYDQNLDVNHNLIQFYYQNKDGKILGFRVVRFDEIEANLKAKLDEENGMVVLTL